MYWSNFSLHVVFNLTLTCTVAVFFIQPSLASNGDGAKAAVSDKKNAVEWTLTQTVRDAGTHTVKISRDAVRIESRDQGFVVLTRAPLWQVDCFRPKEKRWWQGAMKDFTGVLLINPFNVPHFNVLNMQKLSRKAEYAGMHCTQYLPRDNPSYVLLGCDEIDTNVKVAEMLCRYFVVAKIDQVPLMRRYFTKDAGQSFTQVKSFADFRTFSQDLRAKPQITLSTSSIKKGAYVAADFELPSKLRRVKEIAQIGLSDDRRSGFGDLMEEFGNTSGIDKKSADKLSR